MPRSLCRRTTPLAAACALALAALPALAADPQDRNGDGGFDLAEMRTLWPDLGEDAFAVIDANGDGRVDAEELAAARAVGLLP